MAPKNRQLRGRLTGDPEDIRLFFEVLKDYAEDTGFVLTFDETGPFGEFGPIHKQTFGFTTRA